MKQQVKVTSRNVLSTVSVLVLSVALALLAACAQKSGETAETKKPAAVVEIADEKAPLAGPAVQEKAEEAAPVAEQVVAIANEEPVAVPAVNNNRQTEAEVTDPETTEPEITDPETTDPETTEPETTDPETTDPETTDPETTDPETTDPEITDPEITDPETTDPETTDPEANESEQNVAMNGVAALWNELKTEGTAAYRYFATRAKGASLDSTGCNWAPAVNAELSAAGIGAMGEDDVYSYGWRIWKGVSSYDIYFTDQQLAGAEDGTVLESVVKGNTEAMAEAELAGSAEDAMIEGSMEVEVKTMKNQENETVEYSTMVGTSFEADPIVEG